MSNKNENRLTKPTQRTSTSNFLFEINHKCPHSTVSKLSHLTARPHIPPTNNSVNPPTFFKNAYKFTKVNLSQIQSIIYYARLQLIFESLHTLSGRT